MTFFRLWFKLPSSSCPVLKSLAFLFFLFFLMITALIISLYSVLVCKKRFNCSDTYRLNCKSDVGVNCPF